MIENVVDIVLDFKIEGKNVCGGTFRFIQCFTAPIQNTKWTVLKTQTASKLETAVVKWVENGGFSGKI